MTRLAIALILVVQFLAGTARGAVLNVPGDHPDIASALDVAVAGDEVVVAAGTYLEHDLIMVSGVVLRGATGNPADVVIDSERLGRCIYGTNLDATTRIEALTLSNGLPAWGDTPYNSWGAGLMVDGGSPTVSNCVFTANETAIGGGAFLRGTGSPVFEDCVFDANTSTESVGLFLGTVGDPIVRDCVFRNGYWCMMGGGLTWVGSGHALIERCIFEDNEVIESGGGVEVYGASATLRACVIQRNAAGLYGGGIVVANGGSARLENCQITGNSAGDSGGGVAVEYGSSLEAYDSSIRDNTAALGADGIVATTGSASLACCDVDPTRWAGGGTLTIDDENCPVDAEAVSWGALKAAFR